MVIKLQSPTQELETYRVFSAEQDFKYASETFIQVGIRSLKSIEYTGIPHLAPLLLQLKASMGLQVQARRWLAKLFQQPLPDFPLSILLENGYVL